MLDIARWQHNHHPSEGLTYGLGQKFCDMLLRQVSLYKKNRQRPMFQNGKTIDKDITGNLKPQNHDTL